MNIGREMKQKIVVMFINQYILLILSFTECHRAEKHLGQLSRECCVNNRN